MPQLNNNQYAALADEEDDEDNDTESTGAENDGKSIGVRHNEKITGVDTDNERTESGSMGETDKTDETELIEEAISEAERDIAEATDLLAGTETETEDARKKRDTFRLAVTNSGTHIQLTAKKKSTARL